MKSSGSLSHGDHLCIGIFLNPCSFIFDSIHPPTLNVYCHRENPNAKTILCDFSPRGGGWGYTDDREFDTNIRGGAAVNLKTHPVPQSNS